MAALLLEPRLEHQHSKDLLSMDERRTGRFKLALVAVQTPIAILLSVLAGSSVIAEMLCYYLVLYALISLREGSRSVEISRAP